jgi:cytochrome c peroxidase
MKWGSLGIGTTEAQAVGGATTSTPWRTSRDRSLALLLGCVAAGTMHLAKQAVAETAVIETPDDARLRGLESLRRAVQQDGGVPLPRNLDDFVTDRAAAVQLGKALFWDMQVGSDGVQACASCHFHAGADDRARNAVNPDEQSLINDRVDDVIGYFLAPFAAPEHPPRFETRRPNETLAREDFPLIKSIQALNLPPDGTVGPGLNNSNDIVGSMGVFFTRFDGIRPAFPVELGTPLQDPVFNVDGQANVRRVEPRNTPTTINAVFNFTNFWDGHANPHFNGLTAFGDQVRIGSTWVNRPGAGLVVEPVSMDNASLASQAMAPPLSSVEMSFGDSAQGNARRFREIGQKLLRQSPQTGFPLIPLGLQQVHHRDSVLGSLSAAPFRGLFTSYQRMIKKAFREEYWNSTEPLKLGSTPSETEFTQMEANFGLFFGLSVALYESTLVADQSPFDQWMETGRFNRGFGETELAGLNLFVNQGQCIHCHAGPELTKASVRSAEGGKKTIRAMAMADGVSLYDNGFYNISVTPTTDDIGRGDRDTFGNPLAFSRQALWNRLGLLEIPFPILGDDQLPAVDEDLGSPVCEDANANGVCEPGETILPEFQRVAVDGAFKTPGLRNSELTGPYFHNGGMATLRQVVQFYNRGGNFCSFNRRDLDPSIKPLALTAAEEEQLVAFLVSLTDARVKYRKAPFDHPELRIPDDGLATSGTRRIRAVGARGSFFPLRPFLDLDPNDAIFTPVGSCSLSAS